VNSHVFYGLSDEVALVIAGLHGSELSAIEVAHWLRVRLEGGAVIPFYTTILIPEVYPKQAEIARRWRIKNKFTNEDDEDNNGRFVSVDKKSVDPNRQFPKPGEPLSSLKDKTAGGMPLLPETRELLRIIEMAKPTRLASLHAYKFPTRQKATKGSDAPGIFVDPRYDWDDEALAVFPDKPKLGKFNANAMKFDESIDPNFPEKRGKKSFPSAKSDDGKEDDELALRIAKDIFAVRPDLIPGNHVDESPPVVHYAASNAPANPGFSLGDWAPVKIDKQGDPGSRDWGIPDVTVEVFQQYESWAFINGEQFYDDSGKPIPSKTRPIVPGTKTPYPFNPGRASALRVYADAILREFLGATL